MIKKISIFITWYDLRKWYRGLWPNRWGYWRILIPFSGRFYIPSCFHDEWYYLWKEDKDRIKYDEEFLIWCKEYSGKNIIAHWFSYIYYKWVSRFWHYFFNYQSYDTRNSNDNCGCK